MKNIIACAIIVTITMIACNREHTCDNNPELCVKKPKDNNHWWDSYFPTTPTMQPNDLPPGDGDYPNVPSNLDMSVVLDETDMSSNNEQHADLSSVAIDMDILGNPDLTMDTGSWQCDGKILKLYGDQIGVVGATISGNGLTITITSWLAKDDQPGSYYAFRFTTSGDATLASYLVKCGQDIFDDYKSYWNNPNGSSGPLVHGISHIDFCIW